MLDVEKQWEELPTDKYISYLTIAQVTKTLDAFVGKCMEGGKPQAPSMQDLMRVRGYLPFWCKNTLQK